MTTDEAISWALRATCSLVHDSPHGQGLLECLAYLRQTADHLNATADALDGAEKARQADHPDSEAIARHAGQAALQLAVAGLAVLAFNPFIGVVDPPPTEDLH